MIVETRDSQVRTRTSNTVRTRYAGPWATGPCSRPRSNARQRQRRQILRTQDSKTGSTMAHGTTAGVNVRPRPARPPPARLPVVTGCPRQLVNKLGVRHHRQIDLLAVARQPHSEGRQRKPGAPGRGFQSALAAWLCLSIVNLMTVWPVWRFSRFSRAVA